MVQRAPEPRPRQLCWSSPSLRLPEVFPGAEAWKGLTLSCLLTLAHLWGRLWMMQSARSPSKPWRFPCFFMFLLSLGSAPTFSHIALVVRNPLVAAQLLPHPCVFEVTGPRSMPEPGCLFFSFQQSLKTAKPT